MSADGSLVAAGNQDGTVRLWDTLSGRLVRRAKALVEPYPGRMYVNYALWKSAFGFSRDARQSETDLVRLMFRRAP